MSLLKNKMDTDFEERIDYLVEEKIKMKLQNQRNEIMKDVKSLIKVQPTVVTRPKTPERA